MICPKCRSSDVSIERRPDGYSTCQRCRYKWRTDKGELYALQERVRELEAKLAERDAKPMTDPALDLDELERLARVATPSRRWRLADSHTVGDKRGAIAGCSFHPDARFIAAASPDVVLALIARVRELEVSLREWETGEPEAKAQPSEPGADKSA